MNDGIERGALDDGAVSIDDEMRSHLIAVGIPPVNYRSSWRIALGIMQHYVLLELGPFGSMDEALAKILAYDKLRSSFSGLCRSVRFAYDARYRIFGNHG